MLESRGEVHDHACMTPDGSEVTAEDDDDEGCCPHYKYTKRSGDFTSRNGGWTREGMTLYNELYLKVRADREKDNGAFGRLYMEHRVSLSGKKRKRRNANGADQNQFNGAAGGTGASCFWVLGRLPGCPHDSLRPPAPPPLCALTAHGLTKNRRQQLYMCSYAVSVIGTL